MWYTNSDKTLAFILWKKIEHCNSIELIIYDVEEFKQQYAAHKHLTADQKNYYWTREKFLK